MSIIELHNLKKHFTTYKKGAGLWGTIRSFFHRATFEVHAVNDISFSIEKGEIVGFLGPNGAGKTTTLKILAGILYPSAGTVRVGGAIPAERSTAFKKSFGIVMGQKDQLSKVLSANDNFLLLKEFYQLDEMDFKKTTTELIEALDMKAYLDVPIRKLSLGQRMKCELVGALIHHPSILFLDEPTIGLDVVAQKNIRDFIKKYNRENKTTILLTSHYMDDISHLCERIIIINFGRILFDGKLHDLIGHYAKEKLITITTTENVPREMFARYGTIESYEHVRIALRVPREQVRRIATEIMSSELPIDDVLIDEIPLEDIIRIIFEEKKIHVVDGQSRL